MKIAIWLLTLLGSDDALIGDLLERRPNRSRAWIWRQAFLVIVLHHVLTWRGFAVAATATFAGSLVVLSSGNELLRLWIVGYVAAGCVVLLADVASQRGRA
jgi:hypothetical protein